MSGLGPWSDVVSAEERTRELDAVLAEMDEILARQLRQLITILECLADEREDLAEDGTA